MIIHLGGATQRHESSMADTGCAHPAETGDRPTSPRYRSACAFPGAKSPCTHTMTRLDMLDPDMRLQAAAAGDTAVAFALIEHIAAKDPDTVAKKNDAIAVFRECMEAVSCRQEAFSHEPRPIRLGVD